MIGRRGVMEALIDKASKLESDSLMDRKPAKGGK